MSFGKNLAKGFVRSAVNQVGRDGGRVVSNKAYGDKHSIPIRHVNEKGEHVTEGDQTTDKETVANNRADLLNEGYKPELFEGNFFMNFFAIIGSIIIPVLGPLYWLVMGVMNLFRTKTKFYKYDREAVIVSDKRYKTGTRQEGYKKVKNYAAVAVLSSSSERMIFIAKGIINLAIGGALSYAQYHIYLFIIA